MVLSIKIKQYLEKTKGTSDPHTMQIRRTLKACLPPDAQKHPEQVESTDGLKENLKKFFKLLWRKRVAIGRTADYYNVAEYIGSHHEVLNEIAREIARSEPESVDSEEPEQKDKKQKEQKEQEKQAERLEAKTLDILFPATAGKTGKGVFVSRYDFLLQYPVFSGGEERWYGLVKVDKEKDGKKTSCYHLLTEVSLNHLIESKELGKELKLDVKEFFANKRADKKAEWTAVTLDLRGIAKAEAKLAARSAQGAQHQGKISSQTRQALKLCVTQALAKDGEPSPDDLSAEFASQRTRAFAAFHEYLNDQNKVSPEEKSALVVLGIIPELKGVIEGDCASMGSKALAKALLRLTHKNGLKYLSADIKNIPGANKYLGTRTAYLADQNNSEFSFFLQYLKEKCLLLVSQIACVMTVVNFSLLSAIQVENDHFSTLYRDLGWNDNDPEDHEVGGEGAAFTLSTLFGYHEKERLISKCITMLSLVPLLTFIKLCLKATIFLPIKLILNVTEKWIFNKIISLENTLYLKEQGLDGMGPVGKRMARVIKLIRGCLLIIGLPFYLLSLALRIARLALMILFHPLKAIEQAVPFAVSLLEFARFFYDKMRRGGFYYDEGLVKTVAYGFAAVCSGIVAPFLLVVMSIASVTLRALFHPLEMIRLASSKHKVLGVAAGISIFATYGLLLLFTAPLLSGVVGGILGAKALAILALVCHKIAALPVLSSIGHFLSASLISPFLKAMGVAFSSSMVVATIAVQTWILACWAVKTGYNKIAGKFSRLGQTLFEEYGVTLKPMLKAKVKSQQGPLLFREEEFEYALSSGSKQSPPRSSSATAAPAGLYNQYNSLVESDWKPLLQEVRQLEKKPDTPDKVSPRRPFKDHNALSEEEKEDSLRYIDPSSEDSDEEELLGGRQAGGGYELRR